MYGVPKFRENFFMKYKKEVLLSVGAFITIASVVKFVPSNELSEVKAIEASNSIKDVVVEEVKTISGYQVVLNGLEIGVIADESDCDELVAKAYETLISEIGYDPEISCEPALIPLYAGEPVADDSLIVEGIKTELLTVIGDVKQKAFVMRIGDDFTVALESEEAVKEVLKNAQQKIISIGEDKALEVDLEANEHNQMVMTPKVLMVNPDDVAMTLSTSGDDVAAGDDGSGDPSGDGEVAAGVDESDEAAGSDGTEVAGENVDGDEAVDGESSDSGESADEATDETADDESSEEAVEEDAVPVETGDVKEIEFAEEIAIVEVFVEPSEIVDVETATELITKENEEEKIYLVESGDSPWLIANENDMSLSDLYKMNPELEDNEKYMQVGDEVVVMVPEPELKVETKVEIVYTEPIYRGTTYVDDPDTYVGRQTVIDNGSDGVLEITAMVTKLNGEEIDREIIGTERLTEPVNKVVSKGSKPFPVKGATGSYIFPVSGYTITSPFGYRWGSFHHGVDLALATGNPIVAADGGTVIYAGWRNTYGYTVEIDHGDGVMTRYAHCSKILVSVGQAVSKGEDIAKVGSTGRSTGPHVHFEIRFDGTAANPLDYLE